MSVHAYIPASGLTGKLTRLAARTLARVPLDVELNQPLISFTFDDFPKSAANLGAAMLEREGWRGTYFAASGFVGTANHHGEMFDGEDLARLSKAGHEIGCHTRSHIDAGKASLKAVLDDVNANQSALEALGYEGGLETFAFPYGEASPQAKSALIGRFHALRGVRPGINRSRCDRALLRAIPLDGGEAGLARALRAVEDVTQKPGWLIFYGHDIQEAPSEWGCTPDFLSRVIEAVKTSGAQVLTFKQALELIDGDTR